LIDFNRTGINNNPQKTYPYILSGLVKCESCGEYYVGTSAKGRSQKYFYYSHKKHCKSGHNRIDAQDLDRFVLKRLKKIASDDELLAKLIRKTNSLNDSRNNQTERLLNSRKAELSKLEREADNFLENIMRLPKDFKNTDLIQNKILDLDSRKKKLKEEIENLVIRKAEAEPSLNLAEVKKMLGAVFKQLKKLSIPLRREILRKLIHEISISPTQIKIALYGKNHIELDKLKSNGATPLITGSHGGKNGSARQPPYEPHTKNLQLIDISKNPVQNLLENESYLLQMFSIEGRNCNYIAKELEVSKSTVRDTVRRYGLSKNFPGRQLKGQIPYGWKFIKGRLIEHKGEQKIIATMMELRMKGTSLRAIANFLEEYGIKTKNGGKWQASTIMKILGMTK